MGIFDAAPKQRGNSPGIIIPKEIIKKAHITSKKKIKFLVIGAK